VFFLRVFGGSIIEGKPKISKFKYVGNFKYLHLCNNAEINKDCLLLAKNTIKIGENSTLAYRVIILTSANPNGPKNLLSKIYPAKTAPVIIEDNVWVGANAVILPGVKIGRCSVVSAGAIVTKDVPAYTLVAGAPATIKKKFDPKVFFLNKKL